MSRETIWRWSPAGILGLGALITLGVETQHPVQLRAPLDETLPAQIESYHSRDIVLSDEEVRVAGVTNYLMREYLPASDDSTAASFSVYVGYYDSQTQGKTIHSPKNCLPGAGWEALQSRRVELDTPNGPVEVNRYLLQRDQQHALVVYWYQGRGRIEANEYVVKAHLLRDAALRGRTEEALVRIVVPVVTSEQDAYELAAQVAAEIVPSVYEALPAS